jgi:hypothetical protein
MTTKPWFKFYGGEYLSDPKMLDLNACQRSCWITLLSYASQDEGKVRHLSEPMLLVQSGITPMTEEWQKTLGILECFKNKGMITLDNGLITLINWRKRQENSLTPYERVKRYREKKKIDNADNVNDNKRGEERRVEEIRVDKSRGEIAPSKQARNFFHMVSEGGKEFIEFMVAFENKTNIPRETISQEIRKFYNYWTERNKSGTKQKWELESTFEVDKRISKWFSNAQKWSKEKSKGKAII